MKYKQVGATELLISVLGLGTVKFGRNTQVKYPQAFALPSDKELEKLLTLAQEQGINLLDTAPAYGCSEERLGKLFQYGLKNQRKNWIISTKAGEEYDKGSSSFNFTAHSIRTSVIRSLCKLHTDYIDILLIHSNGDDREIIEKYDIFSTLAALKQEGFIRAYGMSTKTIEGGLMTVEHADLAMVTYNSLYTDELPVLRAAAQLGKGILIKKALASGQLAGYSSPFIKKEEANLSEFSKLSTVSNPPTTQNVAEAIHFALSEKAVTSLVIGTINPQHLRECINILCAA